VIAYKPLLDGAIELAQHKVPRCVILQRPQQTATLGARARSGLGRGAGRRAAGRLRPGRRDRSALHPLHLGHDGHSQGRRARQRRATPLRSSGRWARSTAWARARSSGPPRTSAGWSATRTSSTRRSSRAAPRSSTRASRSARRIPARSGVSSPSTA
jgi:hypothetical protein